MITRIKICCISSIEEANLAISLGADAIGLVGRMPSGPGPIVDMLTEGTYGQIRDALPAVKIVQVIHVIDQGSVDQAIKVSGEVDAILLDSGNPNLKIKELGGTGRTHNWELSRQIRDSVKCPVILAGGLKPENVRQAIETVNPYAVDLCSGVRTDGKLDKEKLLRFISEVGK